MKFSIHIAVIMLCGTAGIEVVAQDSTRAEEYPREIYIQQSEGDGTLFVNVEPDLDEVLILTENNFRQIRLRFPDQENAGSTAENLQWEVEPEENITGEMPARPDSLNSANAGSRLAGMLREALNQNASDAGGQVTETETDGRDPLDAFREAFQEVMNEENSTDSSDSSEMVEDIDGMVLDETRSKVGRDFYSAFFSSWEKPEEVKNYIIRIIERPGPSMASVITVDVNYEKIFEMRMHPGDQRIDQAGDYAASEVLTYLKERNANPLTY